MKDRSSYLTNHGDFTKTSFIQLDSEQKLKTNEAELEGVSSVAISQEDLFKGKQHGDCDLEKKKGKSGLVSQATKFERELNSIGNPDAKKKSKKAEVMSSIDKSIKSSKKSEVRQSKDTSVKTSSEVPFKKKTRPA